MATMQRGLDVPGMVATFTASNPARDGVVARVEQLLTSELLALSDDICTHPEVGYKETRSVEKLTGVLKTHGFSVRARRRRLRHRVRRHASAGTTASPTSA